MTTNTEPFTSRHAAHQAKRLSLFVEHRDRVNRRPVLFEVLKRVRRSKLAGVTVFQGHLGYGRSGRLHHTHLLVEDSPLSIVIVDLPELIDDFLNQIDDLLGDVFVVVDDVEVIETSRDESPQ